MRRRATRAELLRALDDLEYDIEHGPPVSEAEFSALLGEVIGESDRSLSAACELTGLDHESTEERAGILQYDAGASRTSANKQAVAMALRERDPDMPALAIRWLFDNAAAVLDLERKKDWSREKTVDELRGYFSRHRIAARPESLFGKAG